MSFRRQIFLKHEDIPKLPNSLVITLNETQFRIFFTDDKITCFLCKAIGHTTNNCKNKVENISESNPLPITNKPNKPVPTTEDHTDSIENILPPTSPLLDIQPDQPIFNWIENTEETKSIHPTQNYHEEALPCTPNETHKRPMSDSSSSNPQNPHKNVLSSSPTTKNEKSNKKPKIQSRTNSSDSLDTHLNEELKPIIEFFTTNDPLQITYLQFKYILDNFNNKAMNIHTLIENANTNIPTLMNLIDEIRPKIKTRSLKTRLTKLSNLLFQTQSPQ